MTRLSFGIPVYNGEPYFETALRSIQEQDVPDILIVISDNGSTDGTQDICRSAAAEDDRIRYHRYEQNRGGTWNFQNVARLCNTELFSWMAADDIKLPAFSSSALAALDGADASTVFSYPRTRLIDGDGVVYEDLNDAHLGLDAATPHERVRNMLRAQAAQPMYGVIRRSALRKTRGFRSLLGPDIVLLAELLCQGPMATADVQATLQRRHDTQVSVQATESSSWFAPGQRGDRSFAETRTNMEIYRGVLHSDLSFTEKVRTCATVGPSWVFPRWRAMARDVANAIGIKPSGGRLRAQQESQSAARRRAEAGGDGPP